MGREGTEALGHGGTEGGRELSLRELVGLGMPELARLARAGELRPEHLGLAMAGAARYHRAIERGDVAGDADQGHRAGRCLACVHHRTRPVDLDGRVLEVGYCGEPFVGVANVRWWRRLAELVLRLVGMARAGSGRPCGCLVTVTVAGHAVSESPPTEWAAGRAVVASKRCPLGRPRWKEVEAIGPGSGV